MNNNLLLQAQKWLTELGIKSETNQTVLKVARADVKESGLFDNDAAFMSELKASVSKKLYFEKGDDLNYHINSF
jgi:hypothetical protein